MKVSAGLLFLMAAVTLLAVLTGYMSAYNLADAAIACVIAGFIQYEHRWAIMAGLVFVAIEHGIPILIALSGPQSELWQAGPHAVWLGVLMPAFWRDWKAGRVVANERAQQELVRLAAKGFSQEMFGNKPTNSPDEPIGNAPAKPENIEDVRNLIETISSFRDALRPNDGTPAPVYPPGSIGAKTYELLDEWEHKQKDKERLELASEQRKMHEEFGKLLRIQFPQCGDELTDVFDKYLSEWIVDWQHHERRRFDPDMWVPELASILLTFIAVHHPDNPTKGQYRPTSPNDKLLFDKHHKLIAMLEDVLRKRQVAI